MNWASVRFDWNQVRAFLATVEEGSLSAAARALGQSQPTVGRQVAALEEELGVTLFERVGRSLELTAAGLELLEHVRAMGDAASRISLAASGQSQAVDGHVSITASDVLSAYVLPDILVALHRVAPGITIEVVASDQIRNLQRREADIAIRHVRPDQPDLIARLVGHATAHFYGQRELLDRLGRPRTLDELAKMPFVGFGDDDRLIAEMEKYGLRLNRENFVATSHNGIVAWELVRNGLGVTIMADETAVRAPEVEQLLPEMEPLRMPVWLAVHRELRTSRRIRLVFDHLADALKTGMARY